MIRAAAYARFSSDNQRDESIDAQLRAIYKFAQDNGYEIVAEYIDRAKTGTNDRREDFQRMIADSASGDFEAVIVHKLDRFARSRYDSAFYKRTLKTNGVQLVSVLEHFGSEPESIIMEGLLESMSEYYSANLSREVKKGQMENALACKHTGGQPPLGYRVTPDLRYEINEDEARTIRLIFDSVINGMSYADISKELNRRGFRTRRGREFGKNSLYEILRNEKYAGVYTFRRSTPAGADGRRNNHGSRNDMIRTEGGIPQIVSREEFEAVQKIMDSRKREPSPKCSAKEEYLLSGKVFCGVCGKTFCGNRQWSGRSKRLYVTYRCNSRSESGLRACGNKAINRDYLEKYVFRLLADVLFDEKRISSVIDEYNKTVQDNDDDFSKGIKDLDRSIKKLRKEIDNLVAVIADTGSAMLAEALSDKERELSALKTERRDIEQRRVTVDVNRAEIVEAFHKGRELLLSGEIPHLKQLIALYVRRIEVYPDYVAVFLTYLPVLKASADEQSLSALNDAYDGALDVENRISREALNRKEF